MENFKNSLWFGILVGISVPILGSAIVMIIFEQLAKMGYIQGSPGNFSIVQERTIYVLGIMFNLIPFQLFKIKKSEKALSGVVMMTILAVFVWVIYYYKSIF